MSLWWRVKPEFVCGKERVFFRVDGSAGSRGSTAGCVPGVIIDLNGGRLRRITFGAPFHMMAAEANIAERSEICTAICTQLDNSARDLVQRRDGAAT